VSSRCWALVVVHGGPAYDQTTGTGYQSPSLPVPGSTAGNGVAVGLATKYTTGTNLGLRAVRWDASGSPATELGNLGTNSSGVTGSAAYAINTAGTAVGFAEKYTGGTSLGSRAVRWDGSGTVATELGNLGTTLGGLTVSRAYAVNTAGAAVGYAQKYTGGTPVGERAVRWDASGSAATELGNLGTSGTTGSGLTFSRAYAVNAAGAAVGHANKYTGGTNLGFRAVRWDASSTLATELGNLGTDSSGRTTSGSNAINAAGAAVGYANKYTGGTLVGIRAVLWNFDAIAMDLNSLIDPASGWTLTEARGISDTNWVSGIGLFDPDGAGSLAAYDRAFLLDVSSVVPEPASSVLFGCASALLIRRRRQQRAN
jgi:hypothetical protein